MAATSILNHSFKTRLGFRFLTGSPGFGRVTGSAGSIFFLKKLKRRRFSKKTKKNKSQWVCNRVLAGSYRVSRVTPGFSFPVFSSTRPGSSPGSAGFWVDPLGRAGFQNYVLN
jgi:hypothetical protein